MIVWKTPAVDAARAVPSTPGDGWGWSEITVRTGTGDDAGTVRGLQLLGIGSAGGDPGLMPLVAELRRLRALLRRELPATADVFILFAPPSESREREVRPFMVEVDEVDADRFSSTVSFARLGTKVTDHA